jgi:hypothetical protein
MADRAKKISELPIATSAVGTDLFIIVANTSGTPVTKQITTNAFSQSFANISIGAANTTSMGLAMVGDNLYLSNANTGAIAVHLSNTTVAGVVKISNNFQTDANGLLDVADSITFQDASFTGNVYLGIVDSNTQQLIHVHGTVHSNVIPHTSGNYTLGNTTNRWVSAYVGSVAMAGNTLSVGTNVVITSNTITIGNNITLNATSVATTNTNYGIYVSNSSVTLSWLFNQAGITTFPDGSTLGNNSLIGPSGGSMRMVNYTNAHSFYVSDTAAVIRAAANVWYYTANGITFPNGSVQKTAYTANAQVVHNMVLAGPTGTSAANSEPSFRALVANDLPLANSTQAGILSTDSPTFTGNVQISNLVFTSYTSNEDARAATGDFINIFSDNGVQMQWSDDHAKSPVDGSGNTTWMYIQGSFAAMEVIQGGNVVGSVSVEPGVTTMTASGNSFIFKGTVPANSTATGVKGEIAFDSSYIYYCVATNTWKRTALSTW